jgi:lipopolysaccharide export system protein LptC
MGNFKEVEVSLKKSDVAQAVSISLRRRKIAGSANDMRGYANRQAMKM